MHSSPLDSPAPPSRSWGRRRYMPRYPRRGELGLGCAGATPQYHCFQLYSFPSVHALSTPQCLQHCQYDGYPQ
ncbi:hypothetical protein PsYK624_101130 [Phanerochaete sordida]|uniref:Uncharacterized protein n=1 Tax=Phanerochaete sordida TaxID=48140 RepID=A0A9P3GFK3_9APHY|nr:hypothetical protein PsYK624_101130 [Phanerochaete sordida]